jgi:hypothetical protein
MSQANNNSKDTRDNFARNAEEVPFFPMTHSRMKQNHTPMSEIEQAQFDFVMQAGLPANTSTINHTEAK